MARITGTLILIQLFFFLPFFGSARGAQLDSLNSSAFYNILASGGEESATIQWSLSCEAHELLKENGGQLIISYITKIGEERIKEGISGSKWSYSEPISIDSTRFTLNNLTGSESYVFKIGFAKSGNIESALRKDDQMVWSEKAKCETERGFGIAVVLILIGALGFFIYGMKLMSEGLQQAAGNRLRAMLGSMTSNRIAGILTGFGITSIVQSSSVTTVMTVSFVNAGLMSLRQSVGVIMGANVGTTITAWLVLMLGFKVSVSEYAYMIIAFATPLLFVSRGKAKAWASTIFGFCILFIGLEVLKDSVPSLSPDSPIVQFFIDYKDLWYGRLMFILLGTIITIIIQSSSAAMALTLTMVAAGSIPFEVACAMILGENIGTTVTAQIASLIGNVHAKRAAFIHTMFNLIGVGWMILVFPWFVDLVSYIVAGDNFNALDSDMANAGIATFHSLFNIANVFVLVWFVPQLVRIAERFVRSKSDADEVFKLDFINGPLGSTAELCVLEAQKEIAKFGKITAKMNTFVRNYINSSDKKVKKKMINKIEKYEEITDRVEVEIADYLGKTARLEMSEEASAKMRGMMNITTDLERIGDIFYQMSITLQRKDDKKIYFTPEQRNGLNKMLKLVEEAFEIMNANLNSTGTISVNAAIGKEREINDLRNELREGHLQDIGSEDNTGNALIYSDMFSSLEKVGDHIINVTEHVSNKNII
jgi:phosphate:Na+ symporter